MATIRVTQHVLEVLTVDAAALSAAPISGIQVTQILFEVLTAGGTSTATSLTGHLLWAYSGASGPTAWCCGRPPPTGRPR